MHIYTYISKFEVPFKCFIQFEWFRWADNLNDSHRVLVNQQQKQQRDTIRYNDDDFVTKPLSLENNKSQYRKKHGRG